MPNIELDSNKIKCLDLQKTNVEDIEKLLLTTEEETLQDIENEDATLTLSAIGGKYNIGPIDVRVAIGNIVLLNEIQSPFITGEIGEVGEELNPIDCFKAIYILAKGKEAVKPIMAIKQRIQHMMNLEKMVEKNPALFEKLMDRVEQISESEQEFENAAIRFYEEHFANSNLQEIVETLFIALNDVMKITNDLPVPKEDVKKK